jgi:hypothetical protein
VTEVPPDGPPDTPSAGLSGGDGTRLADAIVGHLADQARRTATAAKARRVVNDEGEPGMLDLTPLRELLLELVAELRQLRLRDRIARALRQAADMIDSQAPGP